MSIIRTWLFWLILVSQAFVPGLAGEALGQSQDGRYAFPSQPVESPLGVSYQTGRLAYGKVDLSIGPITLKRGWADTSSFWLFGGLAGPVAFGSTGAVTGWGVNLAQGVTIDTSQIISDAVVTVDGQTYRFKQFAGVNGGPNTWRPRSTNENGTHLDFGTSFGVSPIIFYNKKGDKYTFSAGFYNTQVFGLLQNVEYASGRRLEYIYNASSKVQRISSNDGFSVLIEYNAQGYIQAACGFNLAVTYVNSSTGCASSSLKVSYTYYADGNLAAVTDTEGHVTTFTGYINLAGPTCISKPDTNVCELSMTYGRYANSPLSKRDQVATQTRSNGDVWSYTWGQWEDNSVDNPQPANMPRIYINNLTYPDGGYIGLTYDRGLLVGFDGNGRHEKYLYPQPWFTLGPSTSTSVDPATFYRPALVFYLVRTEGNLEYFNYDSMGHITTHSIWPKGASNPVSALDGTPLFAPSTSTFSLCCALSAAPVIPATAMTFKQEYYGPMGVDWNGCGTGPAEAKLCDKPTAQYDGLNNKTEYLISPDHGMVLTRTDPANVAGGIRPQTRYIYAQKYAWIKNASGAYVQAASPIWLLTEESTCKTGAAASSGTGCAIAGDEVRTTYDYGPNAGPNNLLLRGVVSDAGGAALRTCYGYDWRGNRISETKARAGLNSCP